MRRIIIATAALILFALPAAAESRLVMFETSGCSWCDLWKQQVGEIYALTDEGKRAPLTVLNIGAPIPSDLSFEGRARYTPTFVLVDDGVEFARIEGYPGEDFFWGLLEQMLDNLDKSRAQAKL
jgi:thioredoxin-related protein